MKKIALVNPFPYYAKGINEATIYPPLGLAYIASFLETKGIECNIIDANVLQLTNDRVLKEIDKFDPDVVGITINIVTAKSGIELSREIKDTIEKKVILGGPHAVRLSRDGIIQSGADCIVNGEGELTVGELMDKDFNLSDIKGVSYVKSKEIVNNPSRELIKDIDELPFPAYHLLPNFRKYKSMSRKTPMAPLLTSRGCPYQCIYCDKSIFGNTFRPRSPENVIEEILFLKSKYSVKQIDILDDNFTLDINRAEKILDMIIHENIDLAINLGIGVRADRLTKSIVHKMKLAGVYKTGIGIESGDDRILRIIKKSLDLEKVRTAIKLFRDEGIITFGFFIIGFPYETKESVEKTIKFAIEVNPTVANFSIMVPFPGTELYSMIKKEGMFINDVDKGIETGFLGNEFYFKLGELEKEDILEYHKKAYHDFYFRLPKIWELASTIKTFNEFKWTVMSTLTVMKNIIMH